MTEAAATPSPPRARRALACLLWTSALAGLLVAAWAGAVLYVDVQAKREVAALRLTYFAPGAQDSRWHLDNQAAFEPIERRGCRALPALIAALDPEDAPGYTQVLSALILGAVLNSRAQERDGPRTKEDLLRVNESYIDVTDPPEERARKISALRRWWKEEGSSYDPGWRFWSTGSREMR